MAVEMFHQAIGLRVVGYGVVVLNAQEGVELSPEGPGELGTLIRDDAIGDTKPGNPGTE